MNNKISNKEAICTELMNLVKEEKNIVVLTSDSRGSASLTPFIEEYPQNHVEVGIAEQNIVGIAAGLAAVGKIPVVTSPACFLSARAVEQIKVDVAYSKMNVILYGISGGISYGPLGLSHHSVQDIATFAGIPGLEIHIPADRHQSIALIKDLVKNPRPAYVRVGRNAVEDVYDEADNFDFSKANIICEGNDVAIIAVGEMVYYAKKAAGILKNEHNINALLVDMHTIKPLDEQIIKRASDIGKIVTIEEHSIFGGLGSIVSRVASNYKPTKIKTMALPDEPVISGKSKEVFEYYGLSAENIVKQILEW